MLRPERALATAQWQGGAEAPVEPLPGQFSFAPQRFESFCGPRVKYGCLLNAICILLESSSGRRVRGLSLRGGRRKMARRPRSLPLNLPPLPRLLALGGLEQDTWQTMRGVILCACPAVACAPWRF